MGLIRSTQFACETVTVNNVVTNLYTCPAGHRALVKYFTGVHSHATVGGMWGRIERTATEHGFLWFQAVAQPNVVYGSVGAYAVMNAGDILQGYAEWADSYGTHWLAGGVLFEI